jgi:hypothetical protein
VKTIVLVGCGKAKLDKPARAKDLYTGNLFRAARAYAELHGDTWRILSAKYGLVHPTEVIAPYDERIDSKTKLGKNLWNLTVRNAIACSLLTWTTDREFEAVRFVCLAAADYLTFFDVDEDLKKCSVIERPLEGMGIGQRVKFLMEGIKR